MVFGLFGNSGKATKRAAEQNRALVQGFNTQATGALDRGLEAGTGYLDEARDLYRPITELGQRGAGLYADALGVNGAEGNTRATGAFQAGPGFQFMMDQGIGALQRTAAAQGRLGSGQTGIDTLGFAQGLANQEWGSWLDRLGGYNQMWGAGTAGEAGVLGSLADLFQSDAGNRVNLASAVTGGLMGANNQFAAGKEMRETQKSAGLGELFKIGTNLLGGAAGAGNLGSLGSFFGYGK